jgi:hypothetical protein
MKLRSTTIFTAALALGLGTSCVDTVEEFAQPGSYSTQQQSVVVAPQFEIIGVDALPENLHVTEINLRVSEILLQPIDRPNSLAYSFAQPFAPRFDLARGETVRAFDGVEVPRGRYLVSLRLEPVPLDETEIDPHSFEMYGFVAEGPSIHHDEVASDGTPVPLPFKENEEDDRSEGEFTDRPEYPDQWTPFIYESKKTEFFTFSNVEFTPGQQFLTFRFDVRSWALEVVQPISKAVRNNDALDQEGVDATNVIEGSGSGARALIESGVVEIRR